MQISAVPNFHLLLASQSPELRFCFAVFEEHGDATGKPTRLSIE